MKVFVVTRFDEDNFNVANVLGSFEKAIDFIEKDLKEIIINQKIEEISAEIIEDFEEWKNSIFQKYVLNDVYYLCDYWDIGYEIINFDVIEN